MFICVVGDTHGLIDRLFQEVIAFEHALSIQFDWLLHVGDVGIWPDAKRIDRATRNHDGAGDFPRWWIEQQEAPRKTVFIKGNHEDFVWLDEQPRSEILPGLFYLKNGGRFVLTEGDERLSVGGLGGCFGSSDFNRPSESLQRYAKRHYTRGEIDALIEAGHVDILLVHDAPKGVQFERRRRGAGYVSESAGLDDLLVGTQPKVCFFGHHHTRLRATVANIPCIGVNKVPMPGCLVALEAHDGAVQIREDWPKRS